MIEAADVMARLQATGAFKVVDRLLVLSMLNDPPPAHRLPAAYVAVVSDDPGAVSARVGATEQQITRTFGVLVLAQPDVRATATTADQMAELRAAVRTALFGWWPAGTVGPMHFAGGDLVEQNAALLSWQDSYQISFKWRVT